MLDIKFVRENPELVKENIKKKFQDEKVKLVDEVISLDLEYRKLKTNGDELRAERKKLSNEIGNLMRNGKKDEAENIKSQVNDINKKLEKNEELEGKYAAPIKYSLKTRATRKVKKIIKKMLRVIGGAESNTEYGLLLVFRV